MHDSNLKQAVKDYPIKYDALFRAIFSKDKEVTSDLLSAALEEEVSVVEFLDPIVPVTEKEHKVIALDLLAKLSDGRSVNVEIQLRDTKYFPERVLYYWSRVHSRQLVKAAKYDKLVPTISVCIVNYKIDDSPEYKSEISLINTRTDEVWSNHIKVIFLELPKVREVNYDDYLSYWMRFIDSTNKEEIDMLSTKSRYLELATKYRYTALGDEKELAAIDSEMKAIMDYETSLAEKEEQGEENIYKIVVDTMKKSGRSPEEISKETGLSLDKVKKFFGKTSFSDMNAF